MYCAGRHLASRNSAIFLTQFLTSCTAVSRARNKSGSSQSFGLTSFRGASQGRNPYFWSTSGGRVKKKRKRFSQSPRIRTKGRGSPPPSLSTYQHKRTTRAKFRRNPEVHTSWSLRLEEVGKSVPNRMVLFQRLGLLRSGAHFCFASRKCNLVILNLCPRRTHNALASCV